MVLTIFGDCDEGIYLCDITHSECVYFGERCTVLYWKYNCVSASESRPRPRNDNNNIICPLPKIMVFVDSFGAHDYIYIYIIMCTKTAQIFGNDNILWF